MALELLKEILASTGIPFVNTVWIKPPDTLPWGVYKRVESNEFFADGKVYYSSGRYLIELYTEIVDPVAEALIELVLDDNTITYQKSTDYIDSERLFKITYDCEV